jgi:hypothetical protein
MAEDDSGRAPRRAPPAFQEYASDLLADERVREMSLAEVGLLALMRWSCWANRGDVPREPDRLARVLGKDQNEVQAAMTEAVRSFFEPTARTPSRLHCPELSDQRERMKERSAERASSGRRGASARWRKGKYMAEPTPAGMAKEKRRAELIGGKFPPKASPPSEGSPKLYPNEVSDDDIPF